MRKHRAALKDIDRTHVPKDLLQAAKTVWDEVVEMGEQYGYRNAQATVLAPTGTIGFMMDCDTTGVEPDIALVKYKKLVGGGLMKIVNQTVPMALQKLGYSAQQVKEIIEYIDENETIEGAPHIKDNHLPVFDCAFKPARGVRSIHYMGHVADGRGGAAVHLRRDQQDRQRAEGRDRRGDPAGLHRLVAARHEGGVDLPRRQQADAAAEHLARQGEGWRPSRSKPGPRRRKLPDERHALTHKFDIQGHEGYITVGLFEDGTPGEIFLVMAKEGSTISGFADAFAQAISYALQYGVPLQDLVDKFSHVRFEPSGMTKNPDVRFAKSIVDYIFRWMATKFLSPDAQYRAGRQRARGLRVDAGAAAARRRGGSRRVGDGVDRVAGAVVVRGDAEPGRRAALLDLRLDHGALGLVLQVRELRHDERVRVTLFSICWGGCEPAPTGEKHEARALRISALKRLASSALFASQNPTESIASMVSKSADPISVSMTI